STDNSMNPMEDGRGDFYDYDAEGQLTRARYGVPDPATSGDGYQWEENFGGWDNNSNWRGYDALGNRRGWSLQPSSGNWVWYIMRQPTQALGQRCVKNRPECRLLELCRAW